MGATALNCLTTDAEATTFYGVIFGDDYAINKYPNRQTGVVAIVKSNTSPASPLSITWSVVSKIGYMSLTGLETAPPKQALCAINSKGVFTFLIHFGHKPASSPGLSGPRVYQFNPNGKTMDASFNYKGTGSWSNVTVESAHPVIAGPYWFSPRLQLAYNGQVETLILSFIGSEFNVELSALNEASNTLAYAASWKMNATLYGDKVEDAVIIGDRLYTISKGSFRDHISAFVGSFPILSPVSANTPEGRIIDASAFGAIYQEDLSLGRIDLASSSGSLYALAIRGGYVEKDSDHVLISQTHHIDGAVTLGRPVSISKNFFYYANFVPINGQFALLRAGGRMDAITLAGPSLGKFYSSLTINISDSIDPNFKFEAVRPTGESKTGLIVGVAVAVVVLIGAGIGYFVWRKRSKNRATGAANDVMAAPAPPPKDHAYTQGHSSVQKTEPGTDAGYGAQPPSQTPLAGYIGATPAPPTTATMPAMSGTLGQTYQNPMQDLQLSSHPRPNVVSTGAASHASDAITQ
ncbi:hypothetical protein BGZ70_005961 [Mortierella alpina]|uniref:Transmembrane protein n=1 Tax=Mortierella alpina TaxID=64518 RepID=A0A9P6J8Y8_MORAP|nr:hypothetical protein BGZ70_005961 [Mortierella alpina]